MISIKVPPLGESIVEATVSRWTKKKGEAVASGDTIVELETDKITVEVPAPRAGVISSISANEGDVVKVDQLLGELDETAAGASAGASAAQAPEAAPAAAPATTTAAAPAPAAAPSPTPAPAPAATSEPRSSPAARKTAAEAGIPIADVTGTGRGGVVSKPDVIEHASAAPSAVSAPQRGAPQAAHSVPRDGQPRETREKMTTRRRRIAENLLQSQHSTAHLTTFNEVDMTNVNALRERMKEKVEKEHGVKLTFMPFFVKAACMALEKFQMVNAQIDGDSIIYKHYVNMGIAVASDAGLVVPNIKDAHAKGMIEVSRDISEIAKRARDGKLTMDDLTGGTFTITNGGVFGSHVSTTIINNPQV
jgi:2-oxoglutarate dehydrogenase E2 component (dihydrolipoamide succinyltransferase)